MRKPQSLIGPAFALVVYVLFLISVSFDAGDYRLQWILNDPGRHAVHCLSIPIALWMLSGLLCDDAVVRRALVRLPTRVGIVGVFLIGVLVFVTNEDQRVNDRILAPHEIAHGAVRNQLLERHFELSEARLEAGATEDGERARTYRQLQADIFLASEDYRVWEDGSASAILGQVLTVVGALSFTFAIWFALACALSGEPIGRSAVKTICLAELVLCTWLPSRIVSVSYTGFGETNGADDLYWVGALAATLLLLMTLYPLYHPGHEKDLSESWFFPVFVSILPLGPGLILNDLTEPVSQFLGLQLSMKLALYALGLLGLMLATRFAWEESELRSAEVVPR